MAAKAEFRPGSDMASHVAPILHIPGVRILPRPVSKAEFEAFCDETGWSPEYTPVYAKIHGAEDPAWVGPRDAREYALWAGGRIPTALELHLLAKEVPGSIMRRPFAAGPMNSMEPRFGNSPELIAVITAAAEWIEDASFRSDPSVYQFLQLPTSPASEDRLFEDLMTRIGPLPPFAPFRLMIEDPDGGIDRRGGFAFRLVFPDDSLGAQGVPGLSVSSAEVSSPPK